MSLTVTQKLLTLKNMIFIVFLAETVVALCVMLFLGVRVSRDFCFFWHFWRKKFFLGAADRGRGISNFLTKEAIGEHIPEYQTQNTL